MTAKVTLTRCAAKASYDSGDTWERKGDCERVSRVGAVGLAEAIDENHASKLMRLRSMRDDADGRHRRLDMDAGIVVNKGERLTYCTKTSGQEGCGKQWRGKGPKSFSCSCAASRWVGRELDEAVVKWKRRC